MDRGVWWRRGSSLTLLGTFTPASASEGRRVEDSPTGMHTAAMVPGNDGRSRSPPHSRQEPIGAGPHSVAGDLLGPVQCFLLGVSLHPFVIRKAHPVASSGVVPKLGPVVHGFEVTRKSPTSARTFGRPRLGVALCHPSWRRMSSDLMPPGFRHLSR